ncbi:TauD/TfdA family dioxygenase, partial [Pseudomonas aeruginosa]|uniref:TauD/TfdA family dioxygenase n=1 Tax=Pseudomonas aeruginosa TaxID=287 RepID=UPI0031B69360
MSERLSITPLGPYIGAQITGADLTRPLSDNQFEQLYHAVLRHQVVFLRDQAITPQQQRALAPADRSSKEKTHVDAIIERYKDL